MRMDFGIYRILRGICLLLRPCLVSEQRAASSASPRLSVTRARVGRGCSASVQNERARWFLTAEPNLRVSFAPCGALTRHVWAFVLEARAGRMEGEEAEERKGGSMQERELCTQNKSSGIWTVGLPRVFVHFLPPHFPLTLLKKEREKKQKTSPPPLQTSKMFFFTGCVVNQPHLLPQCKTMFCLHEKAMAVALWLCAADEECG